MPPEVFITARRNNKKRQILAVRQKEEEAAAAAAAAAAAEEAAAAAASTEGTSVDGPEENSTITEVKHASLCTLYVCHGWSC